MDYVAVFYSNFLTLIQVYGLFLSRAWCEAPLCLCIFSSNSISFAEQKATFTLIAKIKIARKK